MGQSEALVVWHCEVAHEQNAVMYCVARLHMYELVV